MPAFVDIDRIAMFVGPGVPVTIMQYVTKANMFMRSPPSARILPHACNRSIVRYCGR